MENIRDRIIDLANFDHCGEEWTEAQDLFNRLERYVDDIRYDVNLALEEIRDEAFEDAKITLSNLLVNELKELASELF